MKNIPAVMLGTMPAVWEMLGSLAVSLAIVCAFMPIFIPYLRKLKFGQQIIEEYGPTWHKNKQGVPTMGGLVFIIATVLTFLVFGFKYYTQASFLSSKGFACLITSCLFGLIGFLDDFIKIKKKHNLGLTEMQKLLLQFIVAAAFVVFMAFNRTSGTAIQIGVDGNIVFHLDLGFFTYIIWFFAIIGFTNAVNFTDGIDGLVTGVSIPVMILFVFVSAVMGSYVSESYYELVILSMIMVGALIGFLIFNWHPAKIFMGDTGSMFLGCMVVTVAISLDMTLLLLVAGVVYLIEVFSVIIQRTYFKLTHGKRLFKMTPIHHSFELSGWKEEKIVLVFTAVSVVGCVVAAVLFWLLFCNHGILI